MQWPLLPSFLACVFFLLVGVAITHCVEHDEVVGVVYNLFLYTAFLYPCTTQLVRQNKAGHGRYPGHGACTTHLVRQDGRGEEGAKKNKRRGRYKRSGTNQAGHGQYSGHGVCTPKRNYLIRTNHLGVDSVAGVLRVRPAADDITTPPLNESHTTAALPHDNAPDHDEVVGQVFQACIFVLYTAFRDSCMTHEHTRGRVCTSRRNHLIRTSYLGVESVIGLRRGELAVDVGAVPPQIETHTAAALFGKRFSSDTEGDGPGTSKSSPSLIRIMQSYFSYSSKQPAVLMNGENHYWVMVSKSGRHLETQQWTEQHPMRCSEIGNPDPETVERVYKVLQLYPYARFGQILPRQHQETSRS